MDAVRQLRDIEKPERLGDGHDTYVVAMGQCLNWTLRYIAACAEGFDGDRAAAIREALRTSEATLTELR